MTLWTLPEVADFLKLSESHVYQRIICRPDFPKAVVLPGRGSVKQRRWVVSEVREWVLDRREAA